MNEPFSQWLVSRHISYKVENVTETYDCEVFASNGSHILPHSVPMKHYYVDRRRQSNDFPPQVMDTIDNYLNDLESYAVEKANVLNDNGEPIVESILQNGRGDFEPVWSDSRIQSPADLLLPLNHKLKVEEINPPANSVFWSPSISSNNLSFKNNLFVIYGSLSFIVKDFLVEIHRLDEPFDSFTNGPKCALFVVHWNILMSNETLHLLDGDRVAQPSLNLRHSINFIKVSKFWNKDVISICLDRGMVLIYDLESVANEFNEYLKKASRDSVWNFLTTKPLAVFKTPDSCWSVDIICTDKVTVVAAGHNGPGVSVFIYDRFENNKLYAYEIPSEHNVPSVNFIPGYLSSDGFVTLSYASIYGNVTTVKINTSKFPNNDIEVKFLDTQFFGEYCWTVTPVHKSHFAKVPIFELLNLNFKQQAKKSVLYSVVLDGSILKHQPSSICNSGNFGIGTLTTQIPVPTAALSWRCREGLHEDMICLRFTTFDDLGKKSYARLIPDPDRDETDPIMIINHREAHSWERVILDLPDDTFKQSFFDEHSQWIATCYSDEDKKNNDKWWNSKFTIRSSTIENSSYGPQFKFTTLEDEVRSIEAKLLSKSHEIKYALKMNGKISPVFPHLHDTLVGRSKFFDGHQPGKWSDISGYGLDEAFNDPMISGNTTRHSSPNPSNARAGSDTTIEYYEQKEWALHNHIRKVCKLLDNIEPGSESSANGYKLKDYDDNFFFVTTAHKLYLVKANPLIITSYTMDDIFPVNDVSVCSEYELLKCLNRINFVCHIKEFNCLVVASQLGLISLLKLTEYNGIYSFRQEYVIGWHSQDPAFPRPDDDCILSRIEGTPHMWRCDIDDVSFPFFNITGIDYSYVPYDDVNGRGDYAILYVLADSTLHRFNITAPLGISVKN
ncbi:hypothetical protein KAFR_0C01030 [Kazachstania africana CBS 2517]|uniref:Uncharacterized protein n=1 Tax=Kazachstania africana (strain ATCC 22294 / BCRC 22015 / CBS 2517 / CECT 1963 / NBRC 1671 / NRRL Y-8276) TaxID=1071382 RepID=H2ARU8_KAZAF|nr:hypothetical protein KAFR_0C01030 [Kazachstania africana CBS 2517]CCF57098.1 hypothetical protein KAFR_0C01030 [Kazachstania africana CBS 2517]